MGFRRGVQAEVLLSLALVMITGTALLAGIFVQVHHARIEALHVVLGEGFVAESQADVFDLRPIEGGVWWRLGRAGDVRGLNVSADALDVETRRLAESSFATGESLVESGAPWNPIRFAARGRDEDEVVAGRIDAPVSGLVLVGLVVIDILVFGLFGVTLMQRRVVGPLHRLSGAVREIGESGLAASVPVEGVGEIESLGRSFNEMQDALAARAGALEKAIHDLRLANASLHQARDGLDRAERLAMVGSLAAGVAHEVGNPMGALLAFLDVASRDEGIGDEARHCLSRASEQGERVRIILRQLLDFSRPPQIEHVPIVVREVVEQAIELISAQPEYADIEFVIHAEDGIGRARGDRSITSQILLNLLLNAASAMRESPTKKIRIEIASAVKRRRADDAQDEEIGLQRADAIVCRIGDSGPGIDLEDPGRIFDPFFTTKAPGEGTGLGLANARRLAQELGGSVDVDDERSSLGGALFHFVLCADLPTVEDRSETRDDESMLQSRMP
jgi:signal transduction histidine kinase